MGIRQLYTHEGADSTAGRPVIVYSGEVEVYDASALAVELDVAILELELELLLVWAVASATRPRNRESSFMSAVGWYDG